MGAQRRRTRRRRNPAHLHGHRWRTNRLRLSSNLCRPPSTHIPVIASGGAGKLEDFYEVLNDNGPGADAALAASIFHFGTYTVNDLKTYLAEKKVPVRQ